MLSTPSTVSPLEVMTDKNLLGSVFGGSSWQAWRWCAAAIFGLPADADGQAVIGQCLGGRLAPTEAVRSAWLVVGRRGGKSHFAALVVIYLAAFRSYTLAAGERGVVMIIAADRRQARVVKGYVSGLLHTAPMLEALIADETKESITLTTGIVIEIHTASFRAIRGYTVIGAVLDEIAFWPTDESANPDTEIVNALRPAMATVPDGLLLAISSPYGRRGEMWKAYNEHFGKDGDQTLVWQAETRLMNPSIDVAIIETAYADDPLMAAAEYGAEFRRDLEAFVSPEVLAHATVTGRHELPPVSGVGYSAFVDPSGGSADSMTLAIAHRDGNRMILDAVRERQAPFSPDHVTAEFAGLLQAYRIRQVVGDRYAGEWPRERFRAHGISYRVAELDKSALYGDALVLLNSGRVELLDQPVLLRQLAALERRTTRRGRDIVDHPPRGRDDVSNAVAGALVGVGRPRSEFGPSNFMSLRDW